ncbi:MAG: IS110 family transposase [Alphaproteobacteria bacterium]|nr:IS110 family transposase [Alphaproteobacteria bacterium]
MQNYHNFIGIDIGKFTFVVSIHAHKDVKEYNNDGQGIEEFLACYKDILPQSFCILETTGGYELTLLYTLCNKKIAVHRADTRKVKSFIKSYGSSAKTDKLDAKALARYGFERQNILKPFEPQSARILDLFAFVQRRSDLKQMIVAEKNRLKAPNASVVKESCEQMITTLNEQINTITDKIKKLVDLDSILKQKMDMLKTIPGVGGVTAFQLVVLLPELGTLDRRKIAALAGVAPISNDSGKYSGYRRTGYGRGGIKPILFLSAMAARNSKSSLHDFYNRLIVAGKKKMVALTALMRKILVIANAKLKDLAFEADQIESTKEVA